MAKWLIFDLLQLLAEGATGGGDGGAGAPTNGQSGGASALGTDSGSAPSVESGTNAANPKAERKARIKAVESKYAETADNAPVDNAPVDNEPANGGNPPPAEDPDADFKALIAKDGKYHRQFTETFNAAWNKRHGEHKAAAEAVKAEADKHAPLYDRLEAMYGTRDPEAIINALDEDDDFIESLADRNGLTRREQIAALKKGAEEARVRRENELLRQAADQRAAEEEQTKVVKRVESEMTAFVPDYRAAHPDCKDDSAAMAALYDVLADEQVVAMLRVGVPFATAYQVSHMDEYTETVRKQVTADIRARGTRPTENGTTRTGTATVTKNLTRAERAAIAKRAEMGETIKF